MKLLSFGETHWLFLFISFSVAGQSSCLFLSSNWIHWLQRARWVPSFPLAHMLAFSNFFFSPPHILCSVAHSYLLSFCLSLCLFLPAWKSFLTCFTPKKFSINVNVKQGFFCLKPSSCTVYSNLLSLKWLMGEQGFLWNKVSHLYA